MGHAGKPDVGDRYLSQVKNNALSDPQRSALAATTLDSSYAKDGKATTKTELSS